MCDKNPGKLFYKLLSEKPSDFSIKFDSGKDFTIYDIVHVPTQVSANIKSMDKFYYITDGIEILTPSENYIKNIDLYIALKIISMASKIKANKYPSSDTKLIKKLTQYTIN